MTVLESFQALSKLAGATPERAITKYEKWWDQQPRDEFGKWTSGFSHGAFASSDQDNDDPVDPPENPKAGHENEPGWMGATPQMGVSADHPGIDAATGQPNSGWLPSAHAFQKPANLEVAEAGAKQLSAHLDAGDFAAAKALVHANPAILYPFRKQHHGSVKAAKKASSFLNAVTDATWVQHGTFVNKPKAQPTKEEPLAAIAAQNNVKPEPKPVGAPKLIDYDAIKKPSPGSVADGDAIADAKLIHEALGSGDVQGARNVAKENPQALVALANMKHGSVLEAKSAAAFLHLMTGKTFAQHGTKVNQPKGDVPASSWAHPGFSGTGAPGYTPGEANAALGSAQKPASIIPPPGIAPPPSEAAQAKIPPKASAAWAKTEATPLSGVPKVGGTNPGGFYTLADGTKGYAKFYHNDEQMQTEFLANQVYKKLGINAPDSRLLTIDGKKCIFSPLIKDGTQNTGGVSSDSTFKISSHAQIMSGFAADAILANHDVVGLTHDNIMFTPDGQAHRLDNGGSLKYRAQGSLKNNFGPDAVPELTTMRNPQYGAGKIFGGLADSTVASQVVHVAQTIHPADVAQLVQDAGFKGDAAVEHAKVLNGRIAAALKWAVPHLPTNEQKQNAMNVAQQNAIPEPEAKPTAPVGDKLLGGINPDFPVMSAKTALTTPIAPYSSQIDEAMYDAIGNQDEHAFAQAATKNPAMLAELAQKNWTEYWTAHQTAKLLTHLTNTPHKIIAAGSGFKITKPAGNVVATPGDPNAKASGGTNVPMPAGDVVPKNDAEQTAAYAKSLDYSAIGSSMAQNSYIKDTVGFLDDHGEDADASEMKEQVENSGLVATALSSPHLMSALQNVKMNSSVGFALIAAFAKHDVDAKWDYLTGKLTFQNAHPAHVPALLEATPGTHKSTAAVPNVSQAHLGPLFLSGQLPLTFYKQREVKKAAFALGKQPNGYAASFYIKQFEEQPMVLQHLATQPMTKMTAERFALGFQINGKKYSAKPVKQGGKWVLHFSQKDPTQVTPSGKFDETFMAKHGGADPLTSMTPLALKLKNKHLLPAGVTDRDLVAPEDSSTDHETQSQALQRIKSGANPEAAEFLASHYAHQNAQPAHPLANTQKLYIGATSKLPSPYLRPHEILDRVMHHERQLPSGVTPAMLHAETPEERTAAIAETHQNAGYSKNVSPAKWLSEYYSHRDEAAKPQLNTFVDKPTVIPQSTAHEKFNSPDAFQPGTPHKDVLSNEPGSHTYTLRSLLGKNKAHATALVPQREDNIRDDSGELHTPTHLSLPKDLPLTAKTIGNMAAEKAAKVIGPLFKEHAAALAANDPSAMADPHGSLPLSGVHVASQHGYRLTQTFYKPMLEAARAAMPSEQVIRAMMKHDDDSLLSSRGRAVSRDVFSAIAQKLGIPISAEHAIGGDLKNWGGSAQSSGADKLRVASNMLRGRAPWDNTQPGEEGKSAVAHAKSVAKGCSPDYLKALLLHKAVTQAMLERVTNENGHLSYVRGIGSDAAISMMAKTANSALEAGKAGSKYSATEMSLAGYGPRAIGFDSGARLHRVARPEEVWHSHTSSPQSIGYENEMESILASDDGGPTFTLAHQNTIHPNGNFVTPGGNYSSSKITPGFAHWKKMSKALEAAARDVIKPLAGDPAPVGVPKDREGWYRWMPPDWEPTQAHIDAWHDAFTDPDGVVRFDSSRDPGWMNQGRDPEVMRAAKLGELPAA